LVAPPNQEKKMAIPRQFAYVGLGVGAIVLIPSGTPFAGS
jgi:hypothetical protein